MCIRLKKILKFQKGKQRWNVENLCVVRQNAENFLEDKMLGSNVELGM